MEGNYDLRSKFTDIAAQKLPSWMKANYDDNSNYQKFINHAVMRKVEDTHNLIYKNEDNRFLDKADEDMIHTVFKAHISNFKDGEDIPLVVDESKNIFTYKGKYIHITTSQKEFQENYLSEKEYTYYNNENKYFYFVRNYEKDNLVFLKNFNAKNSDVYTPKKVLAQNTEDSYITDMSDWVSFDKTSDTSNIFADWEYYSRENILTNNHNQSGVSGFYSDKYINKKNYTVSMNVATVSNDDDSFGMVFRFKDKDNYYSIEWDKGDSGGGTFFYNGLHLFKTVGGAKEEIEYVKNKWNRSSDKDNLIWNKLKIEVYDNIINVFIDDKQVVSKKDNDLNEGTFGPLTSSQPNTYFKHIIFKDVVIVEGPSMTEDTNDENIMDSYVSEYKSNNPGNYQDVDFYTVKIPGKKGYYLDDELIEHKIWNVFDEFALLHNLDRLPDENNKSLKERTFDKAKNPSGAHRQGLKNHIARELGILRRDIELNKLSDDDYIKSLLNPDGSASEKLINIAKYINENINIFWDDINWGVGYFDSVKPENFNHIPYSIE